MVRLYLVRHGRAAASFAEARDPVLDPAGRAQAEALADRLPPRRPPPILPHPPPPPPGARAPPPPPPGRARGRGRPARAVLGRREAGAERRSTPGGAGHLVGRAWGAGRPLVLLH